MPSGVCDRLYCLSLGYQDIARSVLLEDGGSDVVRCPTTAVLAHSQDGWFLLDTGLSREVSHIPALAELWFPWGLPGYPDDGDPLLDVLSVCGVRPTEIAGIGLSHLHADHAGGLKHFEAGPMVFIHEAELEYALEGATETDGYYRPEYDLPGIRWQVVQGDAQIAAGITALATTGHTPGHLAYRVETNNAGTWLFAFDAVLTAENIRLDRTGGRTSPAGNYAALRASQERLAVLADAEGARLVPGHCPETWSTLRLPPGHY
jgi:N-acyl homoserine lactone hydrolase